MKITYKLSEMYISHTTVNS